MDGPGPLIPRPGKLLTAHAGRGRREAQSPDAAGAGAEDTRAPSQSPKQQLPRASERVRSCLRCPEGPVWTWHRTEGQGKGSSLLGLGLGGLKGQVTQGSGSEERGADLCLQSGLLGAPDQDCPRRHSQGCPRGLLHGDGCAHTGRRGPPARRLARRVSAGTPTEATGAAGRGESSHGGAPGPQLCKGRTKDVPSGARPRPEGQGQGPGSPRPGLAQGGKQAGLPSLCHSIRGPGPPEEVGANQSQMWEQHKTW